MRMISMLARFVLAVVMLAWYGCGTEGDTGSGVEGGIGSGRRVEGGLAGGFEGGTGDSGGSGGAAGQKWSGLMHMVIEVANGDSGHSWPLR